MQVRRGGTVLLSLVVAALLACVNAQRRERLHEDVTHPAARSAMLSKFDQVKAEHEGHRQALNNLFLDPKAVVKATKSGHKKGLTPEQKAAMIKKMKLLREQIEGDFNSNTKFGRRANCSYPYPAASCKGHAIPPPK
eukprot:CAMPEP_0181292976 /NCGR_PEP_ID=MMETSP1101-20121128/2809_1 /TAXON_ID=46948 /ORGANISM="Rhodomonas abbreviata, Strain Caron Lab Isolate" /LENGTH=136 /DNA_ID=CAMNT_0023397513 /DNA_START=24 /DNA_END=434 /DNA_ORIENTATION=+